VISLKKLRDDMAYTASTPKTKASIWYSRFTSTGMPSSSETPRSTTTTNRSATIALASKRNSIARYRSGSFLATFVSQRYPAPYAGSTRPISNSQSTLIVGLFRNSSIIESFDSTMRGISVEKDASMQATNPPNPWRPDPGDDRTPVGPPDTISMRRPILPARRWHWLFAKAQLLKHRFNYLGVRLAHRTHGNVSRLSQQLFDSFVSWIHASSVCQPLHSVHSYFPTHSFIDGAHCAGAWSSRHA
jgi:hypothetical protein